MTPAQRLDFKLNFIFEDFLTSLNEVCDSSLDCETKRNLDFINIFVSQSRKNIIERIGEELMAKAGYVYLFSTATPGLYKIGESKEPRKRFMSLRKDLVEEVIHKIETDDCRRLEKRIHELLADKRRVGEYFELDEKDIQQFSTVKYVWYEGQGLHHLSLF